MVNSECRMMNLYFEKKSTTQHIAIMVSNAPQIHESTKYHEKIKIKFVGFRACPPRRLAGLCALVAEKKYL